MARRGNDECVLVTRFSALGDVAMTLPVVYGACAANPGTHFVMLTRKLPARLFVSPPENLSVVGIDTALYKGPVGMARLLNEMRGNFGVTTMVDLHDVLRTKIMRLFARLRGMKVAKVDKGRREKKSLTRHSDKAVIQLMPMPQRYKEAFSRAGIDISKPAPLFPSGKGDPALFAKVSAPKQEGEFWLAVAPFAAHAGKIYPLPLLAKVIDHYAEQPHCRVFIFGAGDKERNRIAELAKDRANVVSMAENPIGIEGELALMSHCDTMLAMDSANMHMASLVGLRTVSMWGATHPYAGFYGTGQNPADAVQLDMVCRPCSVFGNKPCARGDYHCLSGISPQLVISRIDSLA